MCGIVAYCSEKHTIEPALLDSMTDSLAHRGPDGRGIFRARQGRVGLGHRRLSILDPSAAGRQPMSDAQGRYTLVHNGEIYNFAALRDELRELGHRFQSDSDTEVVLAAFAEWGPASLDRLHGMFAFAIWDEREERLFAARDRIGIKPLYYYWDGESLILASELRAIVRHPRVAREVELSALRDFLLYGYVPDPKSILRKVYKLRPGHSLTLVRGQLSTERYWDVDSAHKASRSEAEWQSLILEQLDRAVSEQLVSDVPLGAFLSGGVDSSAVVSSMVHSGVQDPAVFCIGFEESKFSELPHARTVCQSLGIELNERIVTSEGLDEDLASLAEIFDEPFGDQSALPTHHLCKQTRRDVTVALSGDGGDENFAGYGAQLRAYDKLRGHKRFKPKKWLKRVRSRLVKPAFGFADPERDASDPIDFFCRRSGHWSPEEVAQLMPGDRGGEDPFWAYRQEMQSGLDPIDQILRITLKTVLPGRMLTKVDRASMAHALEVRVPLLDHQLVSFCASIPIEMKARDGKGKFILKRALESRLPHEILHRPKKGFTPPLREWLGEEKNFERLRDSICDNSLVRDVFDERVLKSFLASPSTNRDFAKRLWDLVMLDQWSRRWL